MNKLKIKALPSSIEYWINKGYDKEDAQCLVRESQKEKSLKSAAVNKGRSDSSVRSKHYWLKQGLSESEAVAKVREIQSNTSLETMIKRYGELEGKQRWLARNEKWINSLNKSGMKTGISKISTQFFMNLSTHVPDIVSGLPEHVIITSNKPYKVDGYHASSKTVIEFFGDYWHANPLKYKPYDMLTIGRNKRMAQDIWTKDQSRVTDISQEGYRVIVVWESQYRACPESTVSSIVSQLLG